MTVLRYTCLAVILLSRPLIGGEGPTAPAIADLPLAATVERHGITWTFAEPARVGRFVNGDHYVVGPVTISAISPTPLHGAEVPTAELGKGKYETASAAVRHGSMLNPPARQEVALDSGTKNFYRPKLGARLPIAMRPGDTLVSSISMLKGEEARFPYHAKGRRLQHDNSPTKVVAVLTCVAEPQPADAFRPAYADRSATIHLARNLRRDRLPNLPRVAVPDALHPERFAAVFERCWFNPCFFGFEMPMENMPHYGQWVGQAVGNAGLLLCLDYSPAEKEALLINLVQVGIDYWGLVKNGHPGWQGWGGHNSGRKFPIVFAGWMLGDEAMASPTRAFPACEFGEDNQTRYGPCWTGATVVFAGHSGISSATGKPPRGQWGPYEHLPPEAWDQPGQRNVQSESYRRANTSCCWVGQALVLRLLKLEAQWNHDPFFDYVDRWMTEDDKAFRQRIHAKSKQAPLIDDSKTWFHQGYAGEPWVKEAWNAFRTGPGMPPTDGWSKPRRFAALPAAAASEATQPAEDGPVESSPVEPPPSQE